MAKRIEGITIEFNGDTTGLSQALGGIDKDTKSIQKELRQVDNLLKFDPSNAELLSQKMDLLSSNVKNTESRLDALRQAQDQVNDAFQKGDIGEDQYRSFQRELIRTEGILNNLRQAQEKVDQKIQLNIDPSPLDRVKNKMEDLAKSSKSIGEQIGNNITSGVSVAAKGIAGIGVAAAGAAVGVGAFVESNKEMNMDLARLEANALNAGFSLESVEGAFKKVSAISGEADSAVETVSNLLQTDFSENQLGEALDYINGAAIRFSDTLNTEGIADGLQETFATGEAIGQFGELLERSGVDLEVFNEGLAKAKANGTETDYVLQQLAATGLADTYEEYTKNNEALLAYNDAQADSQMKLAELATALTPLVTAFMQLGNVILDVILGNTSLQDGFSQLITIVGGFGDRVGELARTIIPKLTENIKANLPQILQTGGEMLTKLIEGITTYIPMLIEKGSEIVVSLIQTISNNYPQILNTAVGIIQSLITGLANGIPRIIGAALNIVVALAGAIIRNLPQILNAAIRIIGALIQGLGSALGNLVSYIVGTLIPSMVRAFNPKALVQTGKDLIQGLINGIGSLAGAAVKAIGNVATGIIKGAKKIFRTASPSKEMFEIGDDVGTGLANGIDSTRQKNLNSITRISSIILKATQANEDKIKEITTKAAEERAKIDEKYNEDRKKLKAKDNTARQKLERDYSKAITDLNKKTGEEVKKIQATLQDEQLKALRDYIKERKENNEVSLKQEADFYRRSYQQAKSGSDLQKNLQKDYRDTVKAINSEVTRTNEEFTKRAIDIDKELTENIKNTSKVYEDEYNRRRNDVLGFYDLFDEVREREEVNSADLIKNQQDQINSIIEYRDVLASLEGRGVSKELVKELRELGVESLDQLQALNRLTDTELKVFDLQFQEKARLATEIARKELEPLAQNTRDEIERMTNIASKELEALNVEWQKQIVKVVKGTEDELKTLHQVGRNAGIGLLEGLGSTQGALRIKAREIALEIERTIRKALDINSPSRLLDSIGQDAGTGLINGLSKTIDGVLNASGRLANAVVGAKGSLNSSTLQAKTNSVLNQQINSNTNVQGLDQVIELLKLMIQNPQMAQVFLDGREIAQATFEQTGLLQQSQLNRQGLTRGL